MAHTEEVWRGLRPQRGADHACGKKKRRCVFERGAFPPQRGVLWARVVAKDPCPQSAAKYAWPPFVKKNPLRKKKAPNADPPEEGPKKRRESETSKKVRR